MRGWFERLPIHQKLVVMALVVTTAALSLATVGLIGVDLWRYQHTAADDTTTLARVIAENTAAAVMFEDRGAAQQTLSTVRVRPTVRRACLYLPNGILFAGFERSSELGCPVSMPGPVGWTVVAGTAPVTRDGHTVGTVYVERELAEIWERVMVAVFAGAAMLLLAASVAFAIADRLHRSVSAPIAELAAAARAIGTEGPHYSMPPIHAGPGEVGDLVRSFADMLRRVREANDRLLETNEALRRKEVEREELLVREQEASRLKDEFLAAVSHELRTPLNAIVGWVQVLSTTTAGEQMTARAIASIARNAKAQTRVIEDLVDVSRIVTGKLHLRFEPVDVRDAVDGALDVIRAAAQAKGLHLTVQMPGDACLVNGDRDRLQQIAWNLLSNAVKFTPNGGTVTVSIKEHDSQFQLVVHDTGVGIARDFLPYVFDRFRQADGSITREHPGLGLGLAIVKELTELHGGSVSVSSDGVGLGARFTVRLPRLAGHHLAGGVSSGASRERPRLDSVSVLAVDDNADALEVLAASLTSAGVHVRVASSGAEAVSEWNREPADVLICDLAMPVMDGFQVLEAIQRIDAARGRVTHAIALTAHVSEEHQARALAAGFAFHLSKPYDDGELLRVVLAALELA